MHLFGGIIQWLHRGEPAPGRGAAETRSWSHRRSHRLPGKPLESLGLKALEISDQPARDPE
jgi:hypothetical protein